MKYLFLRDSLSRYSAASTIPHSRVPPRQHHSHGRSSAQSRNKTPLSSTRLDVMSAQKRIGKVNQFLKLDMSRSIHSDTFPGVGGGDYEPTGRHQDQPCGRSQPLQLEHHNGRPRRLPLRREFYFVSIGFLSVVQELTQYLTGRQIQPPPRPPNRLPIQATQDHIQNPHLAPQRHLRRARQHVHRHPEVRALET